ncbi:alpha/beta hydrolase [Engelhardtia mirabilis]|uniref:Alpha/beta hydrolase family protein n=1 Tax=Engelhardtia mirabilis TaxID=2528011 RepID=A0A518BEN7_9BACT|nr:Alpha/beta hydrolase family protein [Planctomycetes bacterium Pla133]QDU99785.1 Alpha/beta hydrolase family protein [Planctomycetes bacterium Pla86]
MRFRPQLDSNRSGSILRAVVWTLAGIALLAAGSAFVAAEAGAPRNRPVGKAPEGSGLVELNFDGARGTRLSGWRSAQPEARSPEPEFVAVLAHPLGADRRAMLGRADWFRRRGAAVLLFDFRGHGASDATRLTFGDDESGDLIAAVDRARTLWPATPIVVDGWSLGAGAALVAGGRLDVDGLVLEAAFTDLGSAVRDRGANLLPLVGPLAAELLLVHEGWLLGGDPDRRSPLVGAGDVLAPTLFLVGGDDRRAPVAGVRRIAERVADCRGVAVFEGRAHVDLFGRDPERFELTVGRFIDDLRREWRDDLIANRAQ